ncbi:MAG: PepSY domain-containing protein [Pseudomonadota bacterium]
MSKINKNRAFSLLHRGLGVSVAVFVVILAVTGIMLNHTAELGLKQKQINLPWLNQIYGIAAPQCSAAYAVDGHWLSLWGRQVFLDKQALDMSETQRLLGVFKQNEILVLAGAEQLGLFSAQGELVDRLDYPAGLSPLRSGKAGQDIVLEFAAVPSLMQLNAEWTALVPARIDPADISWAHALALPEDLRAEIAQSYQGEGVSLERVVQDIHSGRIAGKLGVYFMDGITVLMLLLVASGAALVWIRRRPSAKHRQN